MKKIIIYCCCALPFSVGAPQKQGTSVNNINILKDYQTPDFGYYSKNYEAVFGKYNYTFDVLQINSRSIFVAPDGNYYSLGNGRQVPFMVTAVNTALAYSYNSGDILSGVLSSALCNASVSAGCNPTDGSSNT